MSSLDTTNTRPALAAPRARRGGIPWPLRAPLDRLLAQVRHGSLTVELPGGGHLEAAGSQPGPRAQLRLHRWRALARLLMQGDLGLAESYRDGDWSTPDLTALLRLGMLNEADWGHTLQGHRPLAWLARLSHRLRANSRQGSRRNIAFHYDLGNDFYAQWLDASMLYSSALYESGDETLEAAQAARLRRILALLDAPAGAKVLESAAAGASWPPRWPNTRVPRSRR